ncbi:MAG: nitrate/nitrite transporter NrtS [Candidatus Acidiferrales bacterium]
MSESPRWRAICLCAFSDGVPRRSFYAALLVGSVLNLINQGDAIFGALPINWPKFVLTHFVPYAVCTYGAVSAQVKQLKAR